MFRYVMTLGFMQLGVAFIINFILNLLKLNSSSTGWISLVGVLAGAQFFSLSLLKKTPNLFEKISRKRLSFLVGVFHLVVSGCLVLLFAMKEAGGVEPFFTSLQAGLGKTNLGLIFIVTLVVAYFLTVGFTYWGLGMGQKMFTKQQQKLSQNGNS